MALGEPLGQVSSTSGSTTISSSGNLAPPRSTAPTTGELTLLPMPGTAGLHAAASAASGAIENCGVLALVPVSVHDAEQPEPEQPPLASCGIQFAHVHPTLAGARPEAIDTSLACCHDAIMIPPESLGKEFSSPKRAARCTESCSTFWLRSLTAAGDANLRLAAHSLVSPASTAISAEVVLPLCW